MLSAVPVTKHRVNQLLDRFAAHIDGGEEVPAINPEEAIAITRRMHQELERGLEERDQRIRAMGHTIACARGCNTCCEQIVAIRDAEAYTIARWLAEPAQAQIRRRFEVAYAAWRERGGDLVDRATAASEREDWVVMRRILGETQERRLLCPFNHEGACEIYPVRPAVCREKAALDSQEPCKRRDGTMEGVGFVAVSAFMNRLRDLNVAMQTSLRPERGPALAPLPELVVAKLAELERPPPGRNDPCSCGSGKKYKKCCGADA
jgi:Fe-S-cluster containining protein